METIIVDFNNLDEYGRVRLNIVAAQESIFTNNIELIIGKRVQLDDSDSLRNAGTLSFSKDEGIGVVEISNESFIEY